MALTPMSILDAVNELLATIGEQPVSAIPAQGVSMASLASGELTKASRVVQAKGWSFNSDTEYELTPDQNGNILLPSNCLKIDPSNAYDDLVWRDGKLYDLRNKTSVFTRAYKFDIVWGLDFDDLPQSARWYITVKAARRFQARFITSDTIHKLTEQDELDALIEFRRSEMQNRDITMLQHPPVSNALRRSYR